jgi:hypothetical protein
MKFLQKVWDAITAIQTARAEYIIRTGNLRRWE